MVRIAGLVAVLAVALLHAEAATPFRGTAHVFKAADKGDDAAATANEPATENDEPHHEPAEHTEPEFETTKTDGPDCVLGDWEPLDECDARTLTQRFVRNVEAAPSGNGDACAPVTETRPCKPVHCHMGPWSEWSACDAHGTKERTRAWIEGPLYGGRACPHSVDRVRCHPEDCLVGPWTEWTCDNETGRKTRTRDMMRAPLAHGRPCPCLAEEEACGPIDCALDDGYDDDWSECDAHGNKHKNRKIKVHPLHGGEVCPPRETIRKTWHSACPPVDCAWQHTDDVEFGKCVHNTTSHAWTKTKVLEITQQAAYGGAACPPESDRTIVEPCMPQPCVMGPWTFKGECSIHGTRKGKRKVKIQAQYGAPKCDDQECEEADPIGCPPVNCEQYKEHEVEFGPCKKTEDKDSGKWLKRKVLTIKTQPRYGGQACRPVDERTVEQQCAPDRMS